MNRYKPLLHPRQPVILLIIAALALLAPRPAQAQAGDWQASYFNNTQLSGEPVLVRSESVLDHDWGAGSPHASVPNDRFSARWTGTLNLAAGRYRFAVTADDGARLWVGERLLVDQWTVQPAQTFYAEYTHGGGNVDVRLEYFENTDVASVRLSWTPIDTADGEWRGEYFNNETLSGSPDLVRGEASIAFNWGGGSPAPGVINTNNFSARWTRTLDFPAGDYRFTVSADDGVRLWVNNNLIIDEWRVQPVATYNGDIFLPGGPTPIRLEYFENMGGALVDLSWTPLGGAAPDAPSATGAPANVWRGEYFFDVNLGASADLVRFDPELNFNWGDGSPAPGRFDADTFSVRWTRTLSLAPGRYQFTARVDDGVRVWVGGQLVIDDWRIQSLRTVEGVVEVAGGPTPVVVEYFENDGHAEIALTWREAGAAAGPPEGTGGGTATVVGARYLNVRSGPGVQYGRVDLLTGGQVVELTGQTAANGWVQLTLQSGGTGWVNGRYLQ